MDNMKFVFVVIVRLPDKKVVYEALTKLPATVVELF